MALSIVLTVPLLLSLVAQIIWAVKTYSFARREKQIIWWIFFTVSFCFYFLLVFFYAAFLFTFALVSFPPIGLD